ncbi:EamA family transporter [Candidatus Dojkabacteria bacterium]|nr:EamA family transporter [Candidatus Dojkabacteria bacterium]
MNWIFASLIMFLSSVAMYLFVRKSNLLKTPQQLNNLAMFLLPVIIYIPISLNSNIDFQLNTLEWIIIIIQAIFFGYLGNKFSLKGIENSPNPGYSLIISKSYVVFTAIASIFLFNAPLTLKSVIAIALIVGFSAVIIVNKNSDKKVSNNSWIYYTIGAFFCWGLLALSTKYLLNLDVPILVRLIYSLGIISAIIIAEMIIKKINLLKISKLQYLILILIGLFSTTFQYFMQIGFELAPNVGYVNAANAGSISLLTLMSALIFKDDLSKQKMIGITGVTIGLLVLFIN